MLKVGVIVLFFFNLVLANYRPLMIFNDVCSTTPTLTKVKKGQILDCARKILETKMLVIFLEEENAIEHIFCKKEDEDEFCLEFIKTVTPRTFLAQAETPVQMAKQAAQKYTEFQMDEYGEIDSSFDCQAGSVISLLFPPPSGGSLSREDLIDHDEIMKLWSEKLMEEDCDVAFFYTGRRSMPLNKDNLRNVIIRTYRTADTRAPVFNKRCAFACKTISIVKHNNITEVMFTLQIAQKEGSGQTNERDEYLTCALQLDKGNMNLMFKLTNHDYKLSHIEFDREIYSYSSVETSMEESFSCTKAQLQNPNNGNGIIIRNMQFQIMKPNTTFKKFSPDVNCSALFSSGTLMVTMVCGLLVAILSCGICFLIDIQTNDRMDRSDAPSLLFKPTDD